MTSQAHIVIDLSQQRLSLMDGSTLIKSYPVCTAKNGAGEENGSECTPRGRHIIRAKIGEGAALGSVFVARRLTGERYEQQLASEQPDRDWILSRILWLSGDERGKNRLGTVDTMRRYIYIHGAPDELLTKIPSSHGCIRMFNADVMDLFDRVKAGARVMIAE
ncbi:MAG: L,D-transpeptidase [Cycloclasticus sp.]|nr:L,D-transpeptidase [Cycloclasticus sp.]MBQ0789645.1 L,D-transpeptidase [Cycloclasticus sp.]